MTAEFDDIRIAITDQELAQFRVVRFLGFGTSKTVEHRAIEHYDVRPDSEVTANIKLIEKRTKGQDA